MIRWRGPLVLMAYHIPPGELRQRSSSTCWPMCWLREKARASISVVKEKQFATQVFAQADERRGPRPLSIRTLPCGPGLSRRLRSGHTG